MKFKGLVFIATFLTGIFLLSILRPYSIYAAVRKSTPTPTPTKKLTPTPTRVVTPTPTQQITPVASATPTPAVSPTGAPTKLGGMNLDGYCNSQSQEGAVLSGTTWTCGSTGQAINMSSACQWQYSMSTAIAQQDTAGNPYSWVCYSSSSTISPTPTPVVSPTPAATAAPTPTVTPQSGSYYLSLGDSFGFGYHLAQYQQEDQTHTYNPSTFNDGYDSIFFHYLQGKITGIQEINYACPGEIASSFINGGCEFHTISNPLHSDYPISQSQFQATKTFLQTHPGKQIITIEIGVNEAINLSAMCEQQTDPKACYAANTQSVLSAVQTNYDAILNMIQQTSPLSDIIIVKYPNPVYQDGSDALVSGLNQMQDNEAASRKLKIADTYSLFTADTVCTLTNYCSQPSDFHPNTSGYSLMAQRIEGVAGY